MNKNYKRLIASTTIATLAIPAVTFADTSFKDVQSDAFYTKAVNDLAKRGIINGFKEDNTFRPSDNVTRAQAAKIIAGVAGLDTENVENPNFVDVPENSIYYGAIAALAKAGIINGIEGKKNFEPNEPMTRYQMAKVISLAFDLQSKNAALPFTDVADFYKDYVQALYDNEITTGKSANTYGGGDYVKRGELATFVYRAENNDSTEQAATVQGEITEISATSISIDGKEFTIAPQLKSLVNETNKQALAGAVIKATIDGESVATIEELVIKAVGTKEQPITLQGVQQPVADVANQLDAISWNGKLVIDTPFITLKNILLADVQLTAAVTDAQLFSAIEKLVVAKDAKINISGDAQIAVLEVNSEQPVVLDLTKVIGQLKVTALKAAIELSAVTKVEQLVTDTAKAEEVIKNYQQVLANISKVNDKAPEKAPTPGNNSSAGETPAPATDGNNNGTPPTTDNNNEIPVVTPPATDKNNETPVVTPPTTDNNNETPPKEDSTVTSVSGEITELLNEGVVIDGVTYQVDEKLTPLFSNGTLVDATIKADVQNKKIVKITELTVQQSGDLNAKNVTIDGTLTINADNVKITGLTVAGDVILTNLVKEAIDFDEVNIKGKLMSVNDNVANTRQRIASLVPFIANEKPKTTLTITFANSVVVTVEISKVDTVLSLGAATQISLLNVQSNGVSIEAAKDVILPNLSIVKGVTQIELNASIAKVEINTNDDVKISGSGNFQSVEVKTEKSVELATTGTVAALVTDNKNVTLGDQVKVGTTTNSQGETKKPEDVISNIAEVSGNVNVEIKQDEFIGYIAAKVIPVEGKFGYVTLSVLNIGNRTIKYRFIDGYNNNIKLPAIGSLAPADAKTYNPGDEFISWFSKDLQVFAVNDKNEIIDTYKIQSFGTSMRAISEAKVENNKIILQAVHAPLLQLHEAYFVNNGQFYLIDQKQQLKSAADVSGIPTFEIDLPTNIAYDAQKMSKLAFYLNEIDEKGNRRGGYISWQYMGSGNSEQRFANDLVALKELVKLSDDMSSERLYWIESILDSYAYSKVEVKDEAGNIEYISQEGKALPSIFDKYIAELKIRTITTATELEKLVDDVNTANKALIDLFVKADAAVNALYKEDKYDYEHYEQLKDGVTKADIEAAQKLVQELQAKLQNNVTKQLGYSVESAFGILEELERLKAFALMLPNYDSTNYNEEFTNILNRYANETVIEAFLDQYVANLKTLAELTPTTLKSAIEQVNALPENKEITTKYEVTRNAVTALLRENRYSYEQYDRLADDFTQEKYQAAEKLVAELKLSGNVGNVASMFAEVKQIVTKLQEVAKINEAAKAYLALQPSEQVNAFYTLKNDIQTFAKDEFVEILFTKYIDAIAQLQTVTPVSIKETVKAVNQETANAETIAAYTKAKTAVDALLIQDYNSSKYNIDERLNAGITKQHYTDAKALVDALQVDERFKQSLVGKLHEAFRVFEVKEQLAKLQEQAKAYVANETTTQPYYDIQNILRNISYGPLGNGSYGNLAIDALTEAYIVELAKKNHTTVAEVKETLTLVNKENESTVQLINTVNNLIVNNKLVDGMTIEKLLDLEVQVSKVHAISTSNLSSYIEHAKKKYYENTTRPEQVTSIYVNKDTSNNSHTIQVTFSESISAESMTFDLAGLQKDVDYTVEAASGYGEQVIITIKELNSSALSTISIEGIKTADGTTPIELKDVPLVEWKKQ
ncbi:MAG: S-layer homology domain-containing protein [Solibacillus sp.]